MNTLALLFSHPVVVGITSSGLMDSLRGFIGPILLFVLSVTAITFLFRREFMQMLMFAIAALVVFALFWHPELLGNLGKSFGDANKDLTWN